MGATNPMAAIEGEHTWLVENFRLITYTVYSDIFEVGGHFWQLQLCHKDRDVSGHISLYLESVETVFLHERLQPAASFKIILVNQAQPGEADYVKESRHVYQPFESKGGFAEFALAAEVLDPDKGFYKNDCLKIRVQVRVEAVHTQQQRQLQYEVFVATDAAIAEQIGSSKWFDLVDFDQLPSGHRFRVHKLAAFSELQQQVADKLDVAVEQQRYWTWESSPYFSRTRPSQFVSELYQEANMIALRSHVQRNAALERGVFQLYLYLETSFPQTLHAQPVLPGWRYTHMLLFFKYFDRKQQKLSYIGHRYFPESTKVVEIFPLLARMAGLPIETDFRVYEEVDTPPKTLQIRLISNQADLAAAGLKTGAVLCIQEHLAGSSMGTTAAASAQGDSQQHSKVDAQTEQKQQQQQSQRRQQCNNILEFYSYAAQLVKVKFTPLPGVSAAELQLQQLWLLPDDDYSTVAAALAAKVGVEAASRIRLTLQNVYSLQPLYHPVSAHVQSDMKLSRMLQYAGRSVNVIYFEVLPTAEARVQELEQQLMTQQQALDKARTQLSRNADSEITLAKLRNELDAARTDLASARADLALARAELVDLQTDLAVAKMQLAARSDVYDELDAARAELAQERAELARRSGVAAELASLSTADLAELAHSVESGLLKIRDAQREKAERERCCPICWEQSKDTAFNCGHQACEECSKQLQRCPICRQTINIKIKLYSH